MMQKLKLILTARQKVQLMMLSFGSLLMATTLQSLKRAKGLGKKALQLKNDVMTLKLNSVNF